MSSARARAHTLTPPPYHATMLMAHRAGALLHIRRLATSPAKGVVRMERKIVKAILRVALAIVLMYILAIKVY